MTRVELARQVLDAYHHRQVAKRAFVTITEIYYRRYPGDPATAEFQAAGNYSRKVAQADAAWYRDEALAAFAALYALDHGRPS